MQKMIHFVIMLNCPTTYAQLEHLTMCTRQLLLEERLEAYASSSKKVIVVITRKYENGGGGLNI